MIYRKNIEFLKDWKVRVTRKPLIIRGARQVGKSYLIEKIFAKEEFENIVKIDFEKNPDLAEIFISKDPHKIIPLLESVSNTKIIAGKVLVFLDEVQIAPIVLGSLRYFYEEYPELHIIVAGSLLDFALTENQFSIPVGRVEYMFMEPLSFEEFLSALGKDGLLDFIRNWQIGETFPTIIHNELMQLVTQYMFIGGMPEAVNVYLQTKSFLEVERIHQSLVLTYMDDFSKYKNTIPDEYLRMVYQSVPQQIGSKFSYVQVNREIRSRNLSQAVDLLLKASTLSKVSHTSANGLPLGAEIKNNKYKLYPLDIGLCAHQLGLSIIDLPSPLNNDFISSKGGFCELLVTELLKAELPAHSNRSLYYWTREKNNSNAEVDFIVQYRDKIVPIEVKAGVTGTLKSLHRFMLEKKYDLAIRFNADLPSFVETQSKDSKLGTHTFKLLSLPFYLIEQWRRLCSHH
jgi:predicted AAA+ superfamily ATPase